MAETVFTVPRIKCDGCASSIRQALAPHVERVDVDIEAKQVRVALLEGGRDPEQLRAVLAEAGFPAS
ncbi:MAG: heavy-metal-associated domain-containing protein [Candidatus Sericytochromatia bacterium]|nr:heavy-metal-associated domain-containing protein [Candidatus Tanganyikabacteria bacterium]